MVIPYLLSYNIFIYPMEGYWTWGGGFLSWGQVSVTLLVQVSKHMAGASAALAGVLLLGARKGKYGVRTVKSTQFLGSNMPLATL
ncbi:hypothetical protein O9992_05890 [Vibrio lentus]|nr:hypothetical protein [Vibrio lentus]